MSPTAAVKGEDVQYFYDTILQHKRLGPNRYKFRVLWNTGERTWEPETFLKEDDVVGLAEYLNEKGLSERVPHFAWARDYDDDSDDNDDDVDDEEGEKQEKEVEKEEKEKEPRRNPSRTTRSGNEEDKYQNYAGISRIYFKESMAFHFPGKSCTGQKEPANNRARGDHRALERAETEGKAGREDLSDQDEDIRMENSQAKSTGKTASKRNAAAAAAADINDHDESEKQTSRAQNGDRCESFYYDNNSTNTVGGEDDTNDFKSAREETDWWENLSWGAGAEGEDIQETPRRSTKTRLPPVVSPEFTARTYCGPSFSSRSRRCKKSSNASKKEEKKREASANNAGNTPTCKRKLTCHRPRRRKKQKNPKTATQSKSKKSARSKPSTAGVWVYKQSKKRTKSSDKPPIPKEICIVTPARDIPAIQHGGGRRICDITPSSVLHDATVSILADDHDETIKSVRPGDDRLSQIAPTSISQKGEKDQVQQLSSDEYQTGSDSDCSESEESASSSSVSGVLV